MRWALGPAAGVLFGLGLLGCTPVVKKPERIDGRSLAPCPSRTADGTEPAQPEPPALRGQEAKKELAARAGTGVETPSNENGLAITRIKYPDGATGSFTIGPNGTDFEFHPPK
jgi:hypothetical protein